MKIAETNPATMEYIQRMQHYNRLLSEKRTTDRIEENRKTEKVRRAQEDGKGANVDVMV
jgi:hypothetical protein